MVLGVQLLQTLGPVLWDFRALSMEFTYQGRRHVLRGSTISSLKEVRGKQLAKSLSQNPELSMLWLIPSDQELNCDNLENTLFTLNIPDDHIKTPLVLQNLLTEFAFLLEEPAGLPPLDLVMITPYLSWKEPNQSTRDPIDIQGLGKPSLRNWCWKWRKKG